MKEKTDDILQRSSLKENPFGTPVGYFNTLQQEVMEKISAIPHAEMEPQIPQERATFMTLLKPALSLAAVFGIVIGMGYGSMKLTDIIGNGKSVQTPSPIAESVQNTEDSELYIVSVLDITIEDLVADEQTAESSIDIISPQIDTETIEQYLIDTGVSISTIALLE